MLPPSGPISDVTFQPYRLYHHIYSESYYSTTMTCHWYLVYRQIYTRFGRGGYGLVLMSPQACPYLVDCPLSARGPTRHAGPGPDKGSFNQTDNEEALVRACIARIR